MRRQTTQPMVIMYEFKMATCASELTAFSAAEDPMLICSRQHTVSFHGSGVLTSDKRVVKPMETLQCEQSAFMPSVSVN